MITFTTFPVPSLSSLPPPGPIPNTVSRCVNGTGFVVSLRRWGRRTTVFLVRRLDQSENSILLLGLKVPFGRLNIQDCRLFLNFCDTPSCFVKTPCLNQTSDGKTLTTKYVMKVCKMIESPTIIVRRDCIYYSYKCGHMSTPLTWVSSWRNVLQYLSTLCVTIRV